MNEDNVPFGSDDIYEDREDPCESCWERGCDCWQPGDLTLEEFRRQQRHSYYEVAVIMRVAVRARARIKIKLRARTARRGARPRARRVQRSSARSGDSGDDDPGEPPPHPHWRGGAA